MADLLSTIFNVLPLLFDEQLYRQWNRTTVLLGELQARPGAIGELAAKNVNFATEFSGATASTVAEGSDIAGSEYAVDINQPATFPWATYRSSFQVSEQEIDAARNANGSAAALRDIFESRILSAGATIASQIEADALTGTGVDANGNPTLVGIYGGALSASGAYGGINANTYSEWAANVLANGGTLRSFSPDLAEQADQNIFLGSSIPWNLVMTSAGVARKYTDLFTQGGTSAQNIPLIRMNDQAGRPVYGLSPALDGQGQLDSIQFKGRKVLRNRLNPAGKAALLNTEYIKIKYLPRTLSAADKEFLRMMGIEGSSGGGASGGGGPVQATGIPMRITNIAKTGDSLKISCRVTLAMGVVRRNCQALIQDISET